jgi:hypothetical protein
MFQISLWLISNVATSTSAFFLAEPIPITQVALDGCHWHFSPDEKTNLKRFSLLPWDFFQNFSADKLNRQQGKQPWKCNCLRCKPHLPTFLPDES